MNGNTEGFEQKKRYLHWKQKGQISLEIKQLNELAQFCKNKVLQTDETKINLNYNDGKRKV